MAWVCGAAGDGAVDGDAEGDGAVDGDAEGDGAVDGDAEGDGAVDGDAEGGAALAGGVVDAAGKTRPLCRYGPDRGRDDGCSEEADAESDADQGRDQPRVGAGWGDEQQAELSGGGQDRTGEQDRAVAVTGREPARQRGESSEGTNRGNSMIPASRALWPRTDWR